MKRVWKIKSIVLRFLIFENNVNVCTKVWLGLEWREEEEWLNPKQCKYEGREIKPHWSSLLEIIMMIQVVPFPL